MHPDLRLAQDQAYAPNGLVCEQWLQEPESEEYGAATFQLNQLRVKFRAAKITPTKVGLFVTLWKRSGKGPIMPHDITDPVDFYLVSTHENGRLGQFVFPREALLKQGVLSKDGKGGKLGFRVYPSWTTTENKQARKSQAWQLDYFVELDLTPGAGNAGFKKFLGL